MFKLIAILFFVFIAGCPFKSVAGNPKSKSPGSQSEDLETRCYGHFFSKMKPVLDYFRVNQAQWDTCKEIIANGTHAEENQIKIQLGALQESVSGVKASLESRKGHQEDLLLNLVKLIPQDLEERLDRTEEQSDLRSKHLELQSQQVVLLETLSTLKDLTQKLIPPDLEKRLARIEDQSVLKNQLQNLEIQIAALQDELFTLNTPLRFEKIGSKFFFIEHVNKLSWNDAASTCRKMGGQLADIKDEEEFKTLNKRVVYETSYWLGISDQAKEDEFISLASGHPAPFLQWKEGQPNNNWSDQRCVNLHTGEHWDDTCNVQHNFICQTDKTV